MKDYFQRIHPIKEQTLETYLSHWTDYHLPKKSIMTSEGQTERYLYFVKEGIQKSYYESDTKQHVMEFGYPPSFCGVIESFFTQTPSKYYLETITDSQFIRISYEKHQALMKEHRAIETLFRKTAENFLLGVIHRQHELMAYDMKTRFTKFVKRSPHLLNMVSQKDLASYLRIDATNFSKLMNTIRI